LFLASVSRLALRQRLSALVRCEPEITTILQHGSEASVLGLGVV
jgi:hypothetical protein